MFKIFIQDLKARGWRTQEHHMGLKSIGLPMRRWATGAGSTRKLPQRLGSGTILSISWVWAVEMEAVAIYMNKLPMSKSKWVWVDDVGAHLHFPFLGIGSQGSVKYIYICAVKLLTGPSLGCLVVTNWAMLISHKKIGVSSEFWCSIIIVCAFLCPVISFCRFAKTL